MSTDTPIGETSDSEVTLFVCGPNKTCVHDYAGWQDIIEDGRIVGGTAICTKCGRTAYEEAQWM